MSKFACKRVKAVRIKYQGKMVYLTLYLYAASPNIVTAHCGQLLLIMLVSIYKYIKVYKSKNIHIKTYKICNLCSCCNYEIASMACLVISDLFSV